MLSFGAQSPNLEMSLHIYIAHTGEHVLADPVSFASPDALRSWIARNTSISPQRQILMTARGKNVKVQTLASENEIFVYDRQYVGALGDAGLPEIPFPDPFTPENPPDTLADQNDLQAWQTLYMARRTWALNLAERCVSINQAIREHNERTDIIHRAVGVALENLKSHVGNLEHKFQEAQTWATELLKEQKIALDGWQKAMEKLETIPARKDFAFLGRPSTPKKGKDSSTGTLRDFLDIDEVQRAASQGPSVSHNFARQLDEMERPVTEIVSETQDLAKAAQSPQIDGSDNLLEEVETLVKKISSDYEHVLNLPKGHKTLASVSRMALAHTKELLPSLMEINLEFQAALERAVQQRNEAARATMAHMRCISSLESRLAELQSQVAGLDVDGEVFEVLYTVFHLPVMYGSVLIEAVRRHEWNEKMKTDSLALAEEMAVFRDEEQRRRKKWLKSVGDFISFSDDSAPGIEINLQGHQNGEWPEVSRKEIESYIEALTAKNGMNAVVQELKQMYADLDNPTRQQRRRAKAFKQGSVFDMGRSSLLLRGDDMVRSLRDEKMKVEEKLKGSESRIRKLEDLLHRQTHVVRPLSANFDIPISPASPIPDSHSRRSSMSSRRQSSNHNAEERTLIQRIVSLEAELLAERETVQKIQKEAHVERQSTTDRIQEAQSTKEDLIKNLEARQKEFEDERHYLETEAKNAKIRIEELEEELFRLTGSRDNERQEIEERAQKLEVQLQEAQTKAAAAIGDAEAKIETLGKELFSEKGKCDDLNSELMFNKAQASQHDKRQSEIESELKAVKSREKEYFNGLLAAHSNLSPEGSPPADFGTLVRAIEILSEGLAIHARGSDERASKVTTEKKSLEERLKRLEAEAGEWKVIADRRDKEVAQLRNDLLHERSQVSVLKTELGDERSQLRHLRSKFAAGETGSEVLRERVAEEERKVTSLSQRLFELDAKMHSAEEQAMEWKTKAQTAENADKETTIRLEASESRAEEISKRLFEQVGKLGRMLEQLGFTLVNQDGKITVQRASKVNGSSGVGDSSTFSMFSSIRPDPEILNWINIESSTETASSFSHFLEAISQFDVEIYGDSVVKRVKDIEVLARKWQKEARGYRDKYHRAQSEAHEKIAYRSFKEGDLALFLPTRNQSIRSWAAFNVGAPHYFLREQDAHKLSSREWLLARISKVEERVVDLSKSINGANPDRQSTGEVSDGASFDDENPFELSDGLRWYLLDATEEKPGAPSTPGLGKSTVASANVDAKGSIRLGRLSKGENVTKTLTKSLDSRRNSSNSKKGIPPPVPLPTVESLGDNVQLADADSGSQPREATAAVIFDEAVDHQVPPPDRCTEQTLSTPIPPPPAGKPGTESIPESSSPASTSSPSKRSSKVSSRRWEKVLSLDYRVEESK